jgi:hypothetical protein
MDPKQFSFLFVCLADLVSLKYELGDCVFVRLITGACGLHYKTEISLKKTKNMY